jgi:hypothetical protein
VVTASRTPRVGWAISSVKAGTVSTAIATRGHSIIGLRPKRSQSQPPISENDNVATPTITVAPIAVSGGSLSVVIA